MKTKGSKLILFYLPFLSYYQHQIKERRVTGSSICNRQRSNTTVVADKVMNENRCIFCQEPIPDGKQICLVCEFSLNKLDLSAFANNSGKI